MGFALGAAIASLRRSPSCEPSGVVRELSEHVVDLAGSALADHMARALSGGDGTSERLRVWPWARRSPLCGAPRAVNLLVWLETLGACFRFSRKRTRKLPGVCSVCV